MFKLNPADGGKKRGTRKIAVSLLKGGVAKSSTSVHLAHGLALSGFRVLLVDTDVQAHCGEILGMKPLKGLAHVICGLIDPYRAPAEARENLWLLAGGHELAGVKMEIARREIAPEAVLADALQHYEGGFDYVILDTAPGWDTLLVNALYYSQEILSPVAMEPLALAGLRLFEDRLAIIQKYNPGLGIRWVVPTFVDRRVKKTTAILKALMDRYGKRIGPPIMYSAKLSETTAFGKTIFEYDPEGQGAQGYRRLTARVIKDGGAPQFRAPLPARPVRDREDLQLTDRDLNLGRRPDDPAESAKVAYINRRRAQPLKQRLEQVESLTTAKGLPIQ